MHARFTGALSERFRTTAQMQQGVVLENHGRLHICINPQVKFDDHGWHLISESPRFRDLQALFPDLTLSDNRILASAAYLADTQKAPTVLVTKDINMQLKARVLGLDAQDYRTDRVEDGDIRRTQRKSAQEEYEHLDIDGYSLQAFASQEHIALPQAAQLPVNHYVLLRNEEEPSHGVPARHLGGGEFRKLRHEHINIRYGRGLNAANLGQRFLLDALYDPAVSLVTVYGKAGTGKTLPERRRGARAGADRRIRKECYHHPRRDHADGQGHRLTCRARWRKKWSPGCSRPTTRWSCCFRVRGGRKISSTRSSPNANRTLPPSPRNRSRNKTAGKHVRPLGAADGTGQLEIEAIAHIRGRSIPRAVFIADKAYNSRRTRRRRWSPAWAKGARSS